MQRENLAGSTRRLVKYRQTGHSGRRYRKSSEIFRLKLVSLSGIPPTSILDSFAPNKCGFPNYTFHPLLNMLSACLRVNIPFLSDISSQYESTIETRLGRSCKPRCPFLLSRKMHSVHPFFQRLKFSRLKFSAKYNVIP